MSCAAIMVSKTFVQLEVAEEAREVVVGAVEHLELRPLDDRTQRLEVADGEGVDEPRLRVDRDLQEADALAVAVKAVGFGIDRDDRRLLDLGGGRGQIGPAIDQDEVGPPQHRRRQGSPGRRRRPGAGTEEGRGGARSRSRPAVRPVEPPARLGSRSSLFRTR
jgi:hypothetical protein